MLEAQQRKEIIEKLILRAIERGNEVSDTNTRGGKNSPFVQYELDFPYCSLLISKMNGAEVPVVKIRENFGRKHLNYALGDYSFDGLRLIYIGSDNGLDEIVAEGIVLPRDDGSVLPPSESLLRSKDVGLAPLDEQLFDAYLLYALRRIKF